MNKRLPTRILATISAAFLCVSLVSPAEALGFGAPSPRTPSPATVDLAPALTSDGTFVGANGVNGTIDSEKWTLVSDLAVGEPPRFGPAVAEASVIDPAGNEWLGYGSNGNGNGALNGAVLAILVSDISVRVAGTFTNAAGIATADYVARWDGNSWHGLGSNGAGDGALNGPVRALAGYQHLLYVGGDFTDAAGIPQADYLAVWTGDVWTHASSQGAVNGDLNGPVLGLAVRDWSVVVGGSFTDAAGIATADYFAFWDGWAWSAAGSNGPGGALNNVVRALLVVEGDIYAGGAFTNAAGVSEADYVARWNGSSWSSLGSNGPGSGALNGEVRALAVSSGDLYVGGSFTDAAGAPQADHVARWNGSSWSALGSTAPEMVH